MIKKEFVTTDIVAPDPYKLSMLSAMQSKPMYQGTVDKATVQRRRAKNKTARKEDQC